MQECPDSNHSMMLSIFQQVMSVLLHRNVQTMDLFLLPRSLRSKVVSLLVSAVKIDREENEVSWKLLVGFLGHHPFDNM